MPSLQDLLSQGAQQGIQGGSIQGRLDELSQNPKFGSSIGSSLGNIPKNNIPTSRYGMYMLRLWNKDKLIFEHWLPENFQFALNSEWEAPYANTSANLLQNSLGGTGGALVDVATASTGLTPRFRYTTMQLWQGSAPVTFNFQLQMRAESDPVAEIVAPVLKLCAIALPAEDEKLGHMLIAPATARSIEYAGTLEQLKEIGSNIDPLSLSSITDAAGKINSNVQFGGSLNLTIGRFLQINDVVIENIAPSFPTRFDRNGIPIECDLELSFKTRFTPTVQDVISWFQGG